jgi:hypothetical protein
MVSRKERETDREREREREGEKFGWGQDMICHLKFPVPPNNTMKLQIH